MLTYKITKSTIKCVPSLQAKQKATWQKPNQSPQGEIRPPQEPHAYQDINDLTTKICSSLKVIIHETTRIFSNYYHIEGGGLRTILKIRHGKSHSVTFNRLDTFVALISRLVHVFGNGIHG